MGFRALTVAAVLLGWALPLGAQQSVMLQFNDGQVTLSAQNAPVRAILAEWARLGGSTIVNGDRVAGPPVTLELAGVPERQALDIVLRSVAGYMLAPRRAGSRGVSTYDRILILPTSVAPRNPSPPAVASGVPRPVLPRPPVIARQPDAGVEVPIDAGQDDIDAVGAQDPATSNQPRAGDPRRVQPPFVMRPPPAQPGAEPLDPDGTPNDAEEPGPAAPAGVAPTPTNPFGIPFGSSATPGVVTPAPRPQEQQQRPGPNRVQ
ncbi:MAG: hypothetical protein HYX77_01125 [Acidobacteria bacterium]|nr:hypothetical protein [Acidobacteriota bacterium]